MEYILTYQTSDFYCSVLLRAIGFQLLKVEKSSKGNSIFIFSDADKKAERTISQYWDRQLKIDARIFVESINELKTRLYSSN